MSLSTYRGTQHPFWDFMQAVSSEFEDVNRRIGQIPEYTTRRLGFGGEGKGLCLSPRLNKLSWSRTVNDGGQAETTTEGSFSPRMDVYETPQEYVVVTPIAGASGQDIKIDFDPGESELTISGNLTGGTDEEFRKKHLKIAELWRGEFERKLHVPTEIQQDKINAKYNNGLLTVTLPKVPGREKQAEKKRITVAGQ